jgi:hypothetical protein
VPAATDPDQEMLDLEHTEMAKDDDVEMKQAKSAEE